MIPRLTEVFSIREADAGALSGPAKEAVQMLYDFSFEYTDPASRQELGETMTDAEKFVRAHPNPTSEPEEVLHALVGQWKNTHDVDDDTMAKVMSVVKRLHKG